MEGDGVRVFTNEELEGIVLRYKDMVYRVAFTHTRGPTEADDVFQEATLEAVRRLPETLRSAVYLFYYEQMSVAETARTLGIQQNAVKTRLSRARAKLKKALGAVRYAQE